MGHHLNSRDAFPNREPTMRGQIKGPIITKAVELARKNFISEAKNGPLKMLIDSPDPHGYSSFTVLKGSGREVKG